MRTSVAVALLLGVLMAASGLMAQEERRWQEISVQEAGLFTMNTSGNGIDQHARDTGGFLVSYRYRLSQWAADESYGFARNTARAPSTFVQRTIRVGMCRGFRHRQGQPSCTVEGLIAA